MMVKPLKVVKELRAVMILGRSTRGSILLTVAIYDTLMEPADMSLR